MDNFDKSADATTPKNHQDGNNVKILRFIPKNEDDISSIENKNTDRYEQDNLTNIIQNNSSIENTSALTNNNQDNRAAKDPSPNTFATRLNALKDEWNNHQQSARSESASSAAVASRLE